MSARHSRLGCSSRLALLSLGLSACQAVAGIKLHRYVDDGGADGSRKLDGSAAEKDAGPSSLCQDYCQKISDSPLCQHEYAVYTEEKECLSLCAKLPPGKTSDRKANSVGCRLYWAGIVGEHSDCPKAGPGGAGGAYCGDNCESYCSLVSQICPDDYKAYGFTDTGECVTKCRGLRDLDVDHDPTRDSTFSAQVASGASGNPIDHDGDTVQCRLYHVSVASESPENAAGHCWHASLRPFPNVDGTLNPCVGRVGQVAPDCEDYCRLVEVACGGTPYAQYDDTEQCLAVCRSFAPGTLKDPTGNTLSCRNYHSYNSLTDPMTHCGHAGPGGGDDHHCGTDCDSYCTMLKNECSPQFAELGDMKSCVSMCSDWRPDSFSYSVESSTTDKSPLACRIWKLAQVSVLLSKADMTKTSADTEALCDAAIGKGACN